MHINNFVTKSRRFCSVFGFSLRGSKVTALKKFFGRSHIMKVFAFS